MKITKLEVRRLTPDIVKSWNWQEGYVGVGRIIGILRFYNAL